MTALRRWRAPCKTQGCRGTVRSSFARLCFRCSARSRRHGDATLRKGITKRELEPFKREVLGLVLGSENRESIEQVLRDLHAHTRETLRANLGGTVWQRRGLAAALRVLNDPEVPALDVGATIAGVFLMRQREPKRFPSDRAFTFQLCRHFRKLSDVSYGRYWDTRSGSSQRMYKELRPQAVEVLGEVLVMAYARFAAQVLMSARHGKSAAEIRAQVDAAFATPEGSTPSP